MLTDAHTIEDGSTFSTDICIIGAGVAGITLAQELIGTSRRVLLLESGGLTFTKSLRSLPTVLRRHLRGEQSLARGRNAGQYYYPLRFTRARAFGGSSRAWASHGLQAAPLSAIDFDEREGLPYHGWPFSRKELDPYYLRAQQICNLGPFEYDVGPWEERGLGRRLPVDESRAWSTMFQFGLDSAFNRYEAQLAGAENVHLMTHATVTEIVVDGDGAVRRVACSTLEGNRFTVEADTVVLAAGAIESARLLLASSDVQRNGIGNQHDLVGRFFMEHPDVEVGYFIPDPDLDLDDVRLYESQQIDEHVRANAMLRLSDDVLKDEGLLNAVVRLGRSDESASDAVSRSARVVRRSIHHGVPTSGLATHIARALGGTKQLLRHEMAKRVTEPVAYKLDIMAEQAPNPDSRVRLGSRRDRLGVPLTVLDWRLADRDWKSIQRTVEVLRACVRDAGVGQVVMTVDSDSAPTPAVYGNWHHLGTTRMHTDPTMGVVDGDCRVHGMSNLYITGGSVFPTGGYANPTLTIAALALRLAEHLR
jgi:choline dehydrogenase-like flavoprotein